MTDEAQTQPVFSVQKIYTKDISFENPNAPDVFLSETQPNIALNLNVQNRQLNDEHWEVTIKVSAIAREGEQGRITFQVEVEQAGIFMISNIPEEHMATILGVDCPTIIFPYTRQVVSQLTADGGFMPLVLEPFNFAAAYQASQQQKATAH